MDTPNTLGGVARLIEGESFFQQSAARARTGRADAGSSRSVEVPTEQLQPRSSHPLDENDVVVQNTSQQHMQEGCLHAILEAMRQ